VKTELLAILQHSLGLDQHGRGNQYRNHFVAGGKDLMACEELTSLGLMTKRALSELTGGSPCFHVTQKGIDLVHSESPKPPKVSRARARYLHWLDVADCFGDWTFGDYLKARAYEERL
jgi:hypothetical protein